MDVEVNQDQGLSHTWALWVKLGLLGASWASRGGQGCGGLLGRGGAGCEAVELSSSEQCWAPRAQQTRSRAWKVFLEARDGTLPLTLVQGLSRGRGVAAQEVSWLFSHQGWLLLGL